MQRSLGIFLLGVVFTCVIAGAFTLSLKLLQSKNVFPTAVTKATPQAFVGTDHPVPADSPRRLAANSNYKRLNPSATPVPHTSAAAANGSQNDAETPPELAREKVEQAREKAERLRAHVEDLYQAHQISVEAYKKGQAEYQHELANYENQIAKLRGATSETGTANE
jgi:hypothetical protein